METKTILKAWEHSRSLYLDFFEQYNSQQFNVVPAGFNNNLIWNVGHVIVTLDKLLYKGSNLIGSIPEYLYAKYQSGTKPDKFVDEEDILILKNLLTSQLDIVNADLENQIFKTYSPRTTGIGFQLESIEDAMACNTFHEGLHLGYMMSIRKFL